MGFSSCAKIAAMLWISFAYAAPLHATISDPRDLSGNVLWLDGSDVDGDFVLGGSFVGNTTWIDKSTAANADAVQTSSSQQPVLVPNVLNGLSVVRFDGVNDIMDIDSSAFGMLSNVAGATLFGVVSTDRVPTRGGQRVLMVSSGSNSAASRAGLNLHDSFGTSIAGTGDFGLAGRRLDSDSFQRIEGGTVTLNEFNHFSGVFAYSAGELSLFVNGQLETFTDNFQTPGSTSATNSLNIRIGADAATNSLRGLFGGDIAELVVYDRALDHGERQMVESYLDDKWFSPTLPGDFNDDGFVGAADYTLWRDNLGATAGTLPNDTVGGAIGAAQYDLWEDNFGTGATPLATSLVPEPNSSWIIVAFGLFLWSRQRSQ